MKRVSSRVAGFVLAVALVGCGERTGDEPLGMSQQAVKAPLAAAYCQIDVNGVAKDAEDDYLPHVITCENGGANLEALKAQAIAARSVAYYAMANSGTICDGQGCQVYSCGAAPQAKHYQAVKETAGMYLSYDNLLTYGFYVAGDKDTAPPACKGTGTSTTEKYVTYNEGKTGAGVTMTTLGYIPPNQPVYGQNRGCMGQWGARCLENDKGYDHLGILRFYYGADIQVLQATGPCVTPVNQPPEGYLDVADCASVRGWAYDPDQPDTALDVQVYVDVAPSDPQASPVTIKADKQRDDLCTAIGSCAHGFEWQTPAGLADGQSHTVWTVALDSSGAPSTELSGSPMSFSCSSSGSGGSAGAAAGGGTGLGPSSGGNPGAGGANQKTSLVPADEGGCGCQLPGAPNAKNWRVLALLALGAARWSGSRRRRRRQNG